MESKKIKIKHVKGSGPGGQHRNKRMTGVEIKDLETGLTVRATERRSQTQNLNAAWERLQDKLYQLHYKPAPRHKTRPTKSSKEKRLDSKKQHSQKKKHRKVDWD